MAVNAAPAMVAALPLFVLGALLFASPGRYPEFETPEAAD